MELAGITFEKIVEMFFILMTGAIAYRFGIIDAPTNKKLSGILLKIISPAMIISSYQIEYRADLIQGLGITLILSALSFLLTIGLSQLAIRKGQNQNAEIERMSVIYSNCGFIGIPLISGLLGREGVFFMSAYITMFNIFLWSHGVVLVCGSSSVKETLKNFVQPATVSIAIGVLLFVFRIRLPEVLGNPVESVGNMNTPVAMLVAGCSLAQSDLLACLKRARTYYISFLKLFAVPLLTLAMLAVFRVDRTIAVTILIAAACPAGASGTMFALEYQKDSNYASELFTITTVMSLITMPVMILFSSGIL